MPGLLVLQLDNQGLLAYRPASRRSSSDVSETPASSTPTHGGVRVNKSITRQELAYPNFHVGTSKVVYVVFPDRRVVFSGITCDGTSTINAAEIIIQEICRHAEINPYAYHWFDLQTCRGYGVNRTSCPHPGEFEFEELNFRPNPNPGLTEQINDHGQPYTLLNSSEAYHVHTWSTVVCPSDVVELFRDVIGDPDRPAHQCMTYDDHDPDRPRRYS